MYSTSVLANALALAAVVTALPNNLQSRGIPNGWAYFGCYTEATSMRALSSDAYFSDGMTVEACADYCNSASGVSYKYFGVEYGRECYCGNVLNTGSVKATEGDCNFACPGDGKETCGAGNRLNVYQRVVATGTGTSVPVPAATQAYSALGCYTDNYLQDGRALQDSLFYSNSMTTEYCAGVCKPFQYFGTEYGRECYCGNVIVAPSLKVATTDCNQTCQGNANQNCGAGFRINIYKQASSLASTSTASSLISTANSASSSSTSTAAPTTTSPTSVSPSSTSPSSTSTSPRTTTSPTLAATTSKSSTLATTTSALPSTATDCATPVVDGYFQETDPAQVPWISKITSAGVTYDFRNTGSGKAPNQPHSGAQQGMITIADSVIANADQGYGGWFNQRFTVCPKKTYSFSAYSRRLTTADTNCDLLFYIASADGNTSIALLNKRDSIGSTGWIQSTGSWDSGSYTAVTLNIRTSCTGTSTGRTFYFDSIDFSASS